MLNKYKITLAKWLQTDASNVTLFWKGRVGLYGLLQALDIQAGDEIIMPAYTCVVVPNAVLYLDAKPIYVDISPTTFNMDIAKMEAAITPKTKVIIAQNTYGLSPDVDAILEIAKARNIKVIEDCTHGFGSSYKDRPNGTTADAAFYSSQWNKPFSTGVGGMVFCKEKELADQLQVFENQLIKPSPMDNLSIQAQLTAKDYLIHPKFYWPAVNAYRFLSKNGILSGSSDDLEITSTKMPKDYLKGMSNAQAKAGIAALIRLEINLKHRKHIASIYQHGLMQLELPTLAIPNYATHGFTYFPLLVNDRQKFMDKAAAARIPLNDWMRSPLHPVEANFEHWQYEYGNNPIAERISSQVVNLPTDLSISEGDARRFVTFLKENKTCFIS